MFYLLLPSSKTFKNGKPLAPDLIASLTISPFFKAVLENDLAPEGTRNTLMIPPLFKTSVKTLKEESEKISDTCN